MVGFLLPISQIPTIKKYFRSLFSKYIQLTVSIIMSAIFFREKRGQSFNYRRYGCKRLLFELSNKLKNIDFLKISLLNAFSYKWRNLQLILRPFPKADGFS